MLLKIAGNTCVSSEARFSKSRTPNALGLEDIRLLTVGGTVVFHSQNKALHIHKHCGAQFGTHRPIRLDSLRNNSTDPVWLTRHYRQAYRRMSLTDNNRRNRNSYHFQKILCN